MKDKFWHWVTILAYGWQTRTRRGLWRVTDGKHSRGQLPHIHLSEDQAYAWVRWPARTVEYDIRRAVKECRKFGTSDLCHQRTKAAMLRAYGMDSPDADITELNLPRWQTGRSVSKWPPEPAKIVANTQYGKHQIFYGNARVLPRGKSVVDMDIRSAYPTALLERPQPREAPIDIEWQIRQASFDDAMTALCRRLTAL